MIKNIFLILLAGCSYGVLSTIVKLAYQNGYSLGEITGSQATFGCILLIVTYCLFFKKVSKNSPQTGKKQKYPVIKLLLTGMASAMISICYYESVKLIPASIAIILLMQYTWISLLLERIFLKTKLNKSKSISLVLILIGTFLSAGLFKNGSLSQLNLPGILYGLAAALFYAIFIIANGHIANHYHFIKKSTIIIIGMAMLIYTVFPPVFIWEGKFMALTTWGLLLAFFGTVLPPILFAIAIPKIGVGLSSILSAIELPTAIVMSYYILKENIDFIQIIGMIIILLAIVITNIGNSLPPITKDPHLAVS